jgi:bifunctional UDP-N-acetylglucosamine pyrophosphorylase/glucosamine-1-phosphate N-acetyltransferase
MKSLLPKVLHSICGRPMVFYSIKAVAGLGDSTPVLVIGHGADIVRQVVGGDARFVVQDKQLGTAHAVLAAEEILNGIAGQIIVISADMPLISAGTLNKMVKLQNNNSGPMTMLIVESDNPRGFGRVVRNQSGSVQAIVEEAQAAPEQLKLTELNVGAYVFEAEWLWPALKRIQKSPKGEYYLTDTVEIAVSAGLNVASLKLTDPVESIGVNNRVHLSEAERAMRRRINTSWMLAGVSLMDPETTFIEPEVQIGRDTIIYPNTWLRGNTVIGEACEIGPSSVIEDCHIGRTCRIFNKTLRGQQLADGEHL